MDRRKLERHMRRHGCSLRREGGSHSIWENPENGTTAAVPATGRSTTTRPAESARTSASRRHETREMAAVLEVEPSELAKI